MGRYSLFAAWAAFFLASPAFGLIHQGPILLQGFKLKKMISHPISAYHVFVTDDKGEAKAIPFQIDEVNKYGDYVLDEGLSPNKETGNGIFDRQDVLVLMGNDVALSMQVPKFKGKKPDKLFQLSFHQKESGRQGSVFVGVFLKEAPSRVEKSYVVFSKKNHSIHTSRYHYLFDKENYLILKEASLSQGRQILMSSTFFLHADFKYFFNVNANHRTLNSRLEAYKRGPIRTIIRVDFYLSFLKINIDVGMFTEVSFYSNTIDLPAVIYSPIDGSSVLNKSSYLYYGFAFKETPENYTLDTNIKPWSSFLPLENTKEKDHELSPSKAAKNPLSEVYWLSLQHSDHMAYIEINPSTKLRRLGVEPFLYRRFVDGISLSSIDNDEILSIHKAPINMALGYDLTKFPEGRNLMSFRLYFENHADKNQIEGYKNLGKWYHRLRRLEDRSFK